MQRYDLLLLVLAVGLACQPEQEGEEQAHRLRPQEVAEGVLSSMDLAADPCQDFYRYACGNWLDTTERPSDKPRWGRSFSVVTERNRKNLRSLVEEAAREGSSGPDAARVGTFYGSCMAQEVINAAGIEPLAPWLEEVASVADAASLMRVAGTMHRHGIDVLFGIEAYPDFRNPQIEIAHLFQGGLGLPERDFYFREDERSQEVRRKYRDHVARMLGVLGESEEQARRHADEIVKLETLLAESSRPAPELRNLQALYHKLDIDGLLELTPELPWDIYLEAIGYPDMADINVTVPEFFERLGSLATESRPEILRTYLRWHLVREAAHYLAQEIEEANFDFYGRVLAGSEEMEERWERCIRRTDTALGDSVGKVFVDRYFAGDSKEIAVEMIEDIEVAFKDNLEHLGWMDDDTRRRAAEKAEAVVNKVGYPDEWRDYSSLELSRDDFFGNVLAANELDFVYYMDKVGGPKDPKEWRMTVPTVNAYYNPLNNEMVFPAGILQPPFFHRDFPAAPNYGAIGAVMGHELTHGFDDQGRKFDPDGRLDQWWDREAEKRYEERAACVKELYDGYEVEPGLTLNGELTLGENIADLGGVKEAYGAYRRWVERHGEPDLEIDGLSDDQLFFVGYAQTWCALSTPEIDRLQAQTNPHSLPEFRVIGPLSNFPTFAQTFGCEAGDAMRREHVCEVW